MGFVNKKGRMEGFNLAPLQGDAPLKVEGVIINAVFNTLIMLLMDFFVVVSPQCHERR